MQSQYKKKQGWGKMIELCRPDQMKQIIVAIFLFSNPAWDHLLQHLKNTKTFFSMIKNALNCINNNNINVTINPHHGSYRESTERSFIFYQ